MFGAGETAELAVRLSLKDGLTPGLNKAQGSLSRFQSGVGRVGKGLGQINSGLLRTGVVAGGIVATGLGAVAKAAIDFDDAFAGVKKTLNQSDLDKAGLTFEDLNRQFRDLATTIPVTAVEIARIGEAAGALGVRASDITEFTRVVAELGVTTNLTTDEAAESLGKVGTILGLTGKQFETFSDTLVNLGNNGASTESEILEITKRFAAAGKQAGLANNEILALASAAASLGIQPEAAGGALSRIFANMATNIALANANGKSFAKLVGQPIEKLQDAIDKGRGLPILMKFLDSLKGLSKTQAAKALEGAGITNTRDRDAILKLAQNYGFLNEQLETAKNSTGALSKEAEKRFNTVRSKLQLLRNNLIEAALTIGGDGSDPKSFIGSIGVAANKLSDFLKIPANKAKLEAFGRQLGEAISGIDWNAMFKGAESAITVIRPALDTLLRIAELLNGLPTEIKGAGAGLLIANKLSGGLITAGLGNIIGGLGETLAKSMAASIPLFGKAFVQPVFVTNPGFGAGGGVGGGAAGAAGGILPFLGAAGVAGVGSQAGNSAVSFVTDWLSGILPAENGVRSQFQQTFGGWLDNVLPTPESIQRKISAVLAGPGGQGPKGNRVIPRPAGGTTGPLTGGPSSFADAAKRDATFTRAIADSKLAVVAEVARAGDTFDRATSLSRQANTTGLNNVRSGVIGTTGAVNTAASRIVGAFHSLPAPIVNVNVTASTVTKEVTYQNRAGPGNGSAGGGGNAGRNLPS